jgi:DNA-binding MarR family transcriptional regulator
VGQRGVPLTVEQTELALEVYGRTGNASEAARAIGCEPSTVTRLLDRLRKQRRAQLHARACDRGLREARRQVDAVARLVHRVVSEETGAGVSLEPRDLATLANTLARLADSRIALADREDRRRSARLARQKTRAEIAALAARDDDTAGDVTVVVRVAGDPPAVDADPAAG